MILSGNSIRRRCLLGLLTPWVERSSFPPNPQLKNPPTTFGLGPAGYDVRAEFDAAGDLKGLVLKPGEFALASTIERFAMPRDLIAFVHDKSTWARRGLAVQNTVIEPGWEGWLTLELSNHGPETLYIERGAPIAQVVFQLLDEPTDAYEGKYQEQARGPVGAR